MKASPTWQRLIAALLLAFASAKVVTFKAAQTLVKEVRVANPAAFKAWFEDIDATPSRLLKMNPGIERFVVEGDKYVGFLREQAYPGGVSVTSVVNFDVAFDGKIFRVDCKEGSLKQTFKGPIKPIVSALESLAPSVQTTNTLILDMREDQTSSGVAPKKLPPLLTNSATVTIKFALPQWFPVPLKAVEEGGSKAVQKTIEADLRAFLDNVVANFVSSTQEKNKTAR